MVEKVHSTLPALNSVSSLFPASISFSLSLFPYAPMSEHDSHSAPDEAVSVYVFCPNELDQLDSRAKPPGSGQTHRQTGWVQQRGGETLAYRGRHSGAGNCTVMLSPGDKGVPVSVSTCVCVCLRVCVCVRERTLKCLFVCTLADYTPSSRKEFTIR